MILNIDTSTAEASVCLSSKGEALEMLQNSFQKDHAAWLHIAIEQLLDGQKTDISDLQAVAIASGPGSYTGLRVGMSAAKGLCYALAIPLITESTLKLMSFSMQKAAAALGATLICPMIEAKRMDVFTAVYATSLEQVMEPCVLTLENNAFEALLSLHKILFIGDGSKKWQQIIPSGSPGIFQDLPLLADYLGKISYQKFQDRIFTDLVYSEPAYIKDFHTHTKK
jgi:tRNA threonylcarbamoyladenosine biosynthesis protein TsaB